MITASFITSPIQFLNSTIIVKLSAGHKATLGIIISILGERAKQAQ
jgi:hypothetical protein